MSSVDRGACGRLAVLDDREGHHALDQNLFTIS
jgi:hypothetical protein